MFNTFLAEFSIVISLQLLALIMPGPDYILVVSNASFNSRKHGFYTAFGIACGFALLVSACLLGLALIITESTWLFRLLTWIGAGYLGYLGTKLIYQMLMQPQNTPQELIDLPRISYWQSWRQGLFCNLFNPKALFFLLSLFTLIINQHTPITWQALYGIVMVLDTFLWFCFISILVTHPAAQNYLHKTQRWLQPILGILLIAYALLILF